MNNKINKKKKNNKKIKINGWVKNKRISKIGILFLDINEGIKSNTIQIIIKKQNINNYEDCIKKISTGCSVKIKAKEEFNSKLKKKEINAYKIKLIGLIKNPKQYPISSKYHTLKYLRTVSHLRCRTKLFNCIFKIRNNIIFNIHKYLQKYNFILINTPIITPLDTEGQSNMFEIKKNNFFKKRAFLSVSGQLNLEACSNSLSKVYNIGPIFRSEKSFTNKHLAEFWMLEIESSFWNINNIIKFSKDILSYLAKKILINNLEELKYIFKYNKIIFNTNYLKKIIKKKFIEINYNEAIKILKNNKKFNEIKWGDNITSNEEKYLTDTYFKNNLIIKNYPIKCKPFYMKINKDQKTVSNIDIILKNTGEVIGGSEREYKTKQIKKNIKNKNIKSKNYWWYKDLRKFGTTPHSGMGMGIERIIMHLTKMNNIRDVIPFPRYYNYLEF